VVRIIYNLGEIEMSQQDDIEKLDVDQIMMCVEALNVLSERVTYANPQYCIEVKRCIRKLKKQYASWMDEESANEVFRKFLIED